MRSTAETTGGSSSASRGPASLDRRLLDAASSPPVPRPQRARPARRAGRRGKELHRSGPRICCPSEPGIPSASYMPTTSSGPWLRPGWTIPRTKPFRSFLVPDLLVLDDLGLHRDDPTTVHRPLRAGHRQASYLQLRHHLQQGCRRVARTPRRLHPRQQRPRPARQRQLSASSRARATASGCRPTGLCWTDWMQRRWLTLKPHGDNSPHTTVSRGRHPPDEVVYMS